jgi:hypothetical protein
VQLTFVASLASAQYGPDGQYGPGNNGGGSSNNPYNGGNGNNPYSGGNGNGNNQPGKFDFVSNRQKAVIAHGVLAALAFVIFFPTGAILIRLGSFRGLWLVHGLFQLFAYAIFIAAFAIGVWLIHGLPINLYDRYHPIIGIIVFVLLFFQPILGLMHHFQFTKYSRRTIWSYGHLWLGRVVITLGIINGGLGMLLAKETGFYVPSTGQIAAYAVVASVMWLAWVAASVVGERRRARGTKAAADRGPGVYKEQYA